MKNEQWTKQAGIPGRNNAAKKSIGVESLTGGYMYEVKS